MAPILGAAPLLITLSVLCLFPPLPSAAAAAETPLAIQICRNTTDFDFCRRTIYSDPHAATADRVMLAYIVFRNAYLNATDTRDYIASRINSTADDDVVLRGLKNCLGIYNESVGAISEVLRDLDDESFYEFDKLSLDYGNNSRACESGFHGRSPISRRNVISIKLADICYAVSMLFPYAD